MGAQLFYRRLSLSGSDFIRKYFDIDRFQRLVASGVFGAAAILVGGEPLIEIVCPAGIEGAVFAQQNIYTDGSGRYIEFHIF